MGSWPAGLLPCQAGWPGMNMSPQDWHDLASVYRAGAEEHTALLDQPAGSWPEAAAHEAMAKRCEAIARQRAAGNSSGAHETAVAKLRKSYTAVTIRALFPEEEDLECPDCPATPGERCIHVTSYRRKELARPHKGRTAALRAQQRG